jgi:hypothetical protein
MTDSEKGAVWMLGVVALTSAAYFVVLALRGDSPVTGKAFALLALMAVPKNSWRYFAGRRFDEREKEIAHKALLMSFRAMWLLVVVSFVFMARVKGMDAALSLPMWKVGEGLCWLGMLSLAVQAATTLVLYRRGSHV